MLRMDGCDRSRAARYELHPPFTARSTGVNPSARLASIGVPSAANRSINPSCLVMTLQCRALLPRASLAWARSGCRRKTALIFRESLAMIASFSCIEIGRIVKPLAHRPQEHFLDLAIPALSGREKQVFPRDAWLRALVQQQLDDLRVPRTYRQVDGELVRSNRALASRRSLRQKCLHLRHVARSACLEQRPGVMAVHLVHATYVARSFSSLPAEIMR